MIVISDMTIKEEATHTSTMMLFDKLEEHVANCVSVKATGGIKDTRKAPADERIPSPLTYWKYSFRSARR